jgi:hypothetical protein
VLAASGAGKFVGEVIVVGSDGRVRWRAKLPVMAAMDGYIAASSDVVAVQVADHLFAWHAQDGTAIALPTH